MFAPNCAGQRPTWATMSGQSQCCMCRPRFAAELPIAVPYLQAESLFYHNSDSKFMFFCINSESKNKLNMEFTCHVSVLGHLVMFICIVFSSPSRWPGTRFQACRQLHQVGVRDPCLVSTITCIFLKMFFLIQNFASFVNFSWFMCIAGPRIVLRWQLF